MKESFTGFQGAKFLNALCLIYFGVSWSIISNMAILSIPG
jgi:hypothetical protein